MPLQDVIDFILPLRGKRLAVVPHIRPDGDAAGSALGLCGILRTAGVHAYAVNIAPYPNNLRFLALPELDRVHPEPDWPERYDALAVVDCGEWRRLDPANRVAEGRLPTMNIDHHATSAGVGEAVWIEADASSTGEMIVRLARTAGWAIPPHAAQALWTAIVTDTGRFCYENAGVPALEAATECVRRGANPAEAAAHLYQSVSRNELALRHRVVEHMEFSMDGRLAVSWLSRRDFVESGLEADGVEGLGDVLRSVEGVEASLFLYEMKPGAERDGKIKLSVRTRAPHDATLLAKRFGGGGHHRAAGCSVNMPLADARKAIVGLAEELWF